MRIITINVPDPYLEAFDLLVASGCFPSRSETIRCACRDFFIKEFKLIEKLKKLDREKEYSARIPRNFVLPPATGGRKAKPIEAINYEWGAKAFEIRRNLGFINEAGEDIEQ